MSIKCELKKTKIYQFKSIMAEDTRRIKRIDHGFSKRILLKSCATAKPIFENADSIKKIETILHKSSIEIGRSSFFYSLDERVMIYCKNQVIDNMPCDYTVFIRNSIQNLYDLQNDDNVGNQNKRLIEVVEKYLDKSIRECEKAGRIDLSDSLKDMRNNPAQDLRGALQRILFWNQLLWQTGHRLIGLGRLDKLLSGFPLDEALLEEFLLLLHDHYNYKSSAMLGDTGQIILLGGSEIDGSYFCNEYTYAIIKILNKAKLPDPKILMRVSSNMPSELLDLTVDGIASGTGSPLLSNDEVVIPALIKFGYNQDDACNYGVSACWEPLSIGNSLEQNNLYNIEFGKVVADMVVSDSLVDCINFEEVLNTYKNNLKQHLQELFTQLSNISWERDPLFTLSMACCWNSNRDISEGGARYNNYGLLSVGLGSTVDSLLNINKFVFEEKRVSMAKLCEEIATGRDDSDLLNNLKATAGKYGSSDKDAIDLTKDLLQFVESVLMSYKNKFGGKVKFGLSSPSYVNGGRKTEATADGRKAYTPFATHISNSKSELTDIMYFAGQLDYSCLRSNGNVVDIVLTSDLVNNNRDKFIVYILGAIKSGFFQCQFNVLSYEKLVDAKVHPEKYPDLIVRVWGFSAYFKDIPEEYQDVLIERAKQSEGVA